MDAFTVPLPLIAAAVGVAPVYVAPSKTVLYALIVDPYAPAAVIVNFGFDLLCTNPPNVVLISDTVSAAATLEIVGTTVDGTVIVKLELTADPIFVLPEYVVTVTFAVPLVAFGIAFNQVCGIV